MLLGVMKTFIVFLVGCVSLINGGEYLNRFTQQYNKIHDAANGYFSPKGIPYHAVETLIVEAPDYGHQTTSEAYSYWLWLEAMYGAVNGDFSKFTAAWQNMETYMIPNHASQPTNNYYNPGKPATFAPEGDYPNQYPSQMQFNVPVGQDPIYQELVNTYGTSDVYLMNWLLDVDNKYGFGNQPGQCQLGPSVEGPSFMNSFQRGPQESVWRTIPQTTCDNFRFGGQNGFLDLFVGDSHYEQQWKYTIASDAEARAIQAAFWALQWAKDKNQQGAVSDTISKASKMGDFLRYAFFDKYFKKIGNCIGTYACPGGYGKDSAHYLLSWYMAWGGSLYGNWAWRISDFYAHFGYQNPMTAYVMSKVDEFKPRSPTGVSDWEMSLERQIEFYEYLQSKEGAFAGGATNSYEGRYETPPANLMNNTFHGMWYEWEPVYHNPPSNRWFGMQAWSTDRLAQYYYVSGDEKVRPLLDKWVNWVLPEISYDANSYKIPEWLDWSGVPPAVDVSIEKYGTDIGSASALARTLSYYAAKTGDQKVKAVAKGLLDGIWNNHQTTKGVAMEEVMDAYSQFNEEVYVPPGWVGHYPDGTEIKAPTTFIGIRPWYKNDPDWPKVEAYLNGGPAPKFTYHRFWQQCDIAIAQGTYGLLFNE
uniref:Glycoside hydrolase family protein 48 n=3 Tax=Endopterygota TaxID=33392 RepID=E7CIZ1_LEPDE|nr:glycoside hydrolase family protein 48 [Leptinotarsa decemlineata]